MPRRIAGRELLDLLGKAGRQTAILDLRSPLERSNGHIAVSAGIPYHDLEQRIATLVPNRGATVVLAGAQQVDERGAALLERLGYRDVAILDNGIDGWKSAGGRVYTGTNVRSKTLGEWIERRYSTPTVDSDTVDEWRREGADVVVIDSRPASEYVHHHIPGAYNSGGGAEIAFRTAQVVQDPGTKVVINCAGRTRGIVAAQSLINTGIPNPVYSLHNGTPAWERSGHPLAFGDGPAVPAPEQVSPQLAEWAATTLAKAGAAVVDIDDVRTGLGDDATTTYLLDVRTPQEYQLGHYSAAVSAPGGQLVQATDEYIAVRGARVVLVDTPDFVRAANTAQWLRFLHDGPLSVLAHLPGADIARPQPTAVPVPDVPRVSWDELEEWRSRGPVWIVDLRSSNGYAAGHIPGSIHARREHLDNIVADTGAGRVVLVGGSEYAAEHVAATLPGTWVLTGGIDAATDLTADDGQYAGEIVDRTGPPDFGPERDAWYADYFAWELSLLSESDGDPFFDFDAVDDR
ncbi:sulfurtransferase [Mycolicibacterium agri]|uniref:Sulfurtransferase n=1 Tax=Mycolicibacterium agri TaxID=36811 RepID=A0A2A7N607_MYCAG|nr:rhodanese-like domain-containing protein [Mycolicibacterium agri]PEG38921.1 sulfurtransferase [Mycolicibacterium agri]GFG53213.1 sulfurtransferase [Mycolicibacterium agri]